MEVADLRLLRQLGRAPARQRLPRHSGTARGPRVGQIRPWRSGRLAWLPLGQGGPLCDRGPCAGGGHNASPRTASRCRRDRRSRHAGRLGGHGGRRAQGSVPGRAVWSARLFGLGAVLSHGPGVPAAALQPAATGRRRASARARAPWRGANSIAATCIAPATTAIIPAALSEAVPPVHSGAKAAAK